MVRVVEERFWCVRAPENLRDADRAEVLNSLLHETSPCPSDERHIRPGPRLGNLSLALRTARPKDFVWSWTGELLCTQDVLAILQDEKITGFETRPVTTQSKSRAASRQPLPVYHEIVTTGWAGMAAPASGLEIVRFCPECHTRRYRITEPAHLIDKTAWDGSDWFMVWPLPKFHFISDHTAELIRSRGFSGIEIVAADKVFSEAKTFGPGLLRCYMPEARARRLGEPLGIY